MSQLRLNCENCRRVTQVSAQSGVELEGYRQNPHILGLQKGWMYQFSALAGFIFHVPDLGFLCSLPR